MKTNDSWKFKKIGKFEKMIMNVLNSLLVVFAYSIFREGWIGSYYSLLEGYRKAAFELFFGIFLIIGIISIPIQIKIKKSSACYYKKHIKYILVASTLIIFLFEYFLIP